MFIVHVQLLLHCTPPLTIDCGDLVFSDGPSVVRPLIRAPLTLL